MAFVADGICGMHSTAFWRGTRLGQPHRDTGAPIPSLRVVASYGRADQQISRAWDDRLTAFSDKM